MKYWQHNAQRKREHADICCVWCVKVTAENEREIERHCLATTEATVSNEKSVMTSEYAAIAVFLIWFSGVAGLVGGERASGPILFGSWMTMSEYLRDGG